MKNLKKALLVSLVMGSLCTGLTACDDASSTLDSTAEITTSEETTSEETTSVAVVSRIVVTTPDDDPVVGEIIDLDDYVTVVGGEGEKVYTAVVTTPDTASVTDHILTILAEGEVSVTISSGTKTSKFSVTAVSALLSKYIDYTGAIGNNFAVEALGVDEITGGLVGTDEGWVHSDDYWAYSTEMYSDTAGANQYEGILRAGTGDSYWFTSDDRLGTNLEVEAGKASDPSAYYLGQSYLDISTSLSTVYDDETGEESSLYTDSFGNFVKIACGYDLSSYDIVMTFEFADVTRVGETEASEELVMVWYYRASSDEEYSIDSIYAIETAEEDYTMPEIESYIDAGTTPEAMTLGEFTSAADAIVVAKNYTMESSMGYAYSDGTALTDEEVTTSGYSLPNQTATTYVDGSTIYNYVNEDGTVYGVTTDGTTLSTFNNLDEDYIPTTANVLTADADATEAQIADVWEYASTAALLADETIVDGLNVTAKVTAEDGTITAEGTGLDCNDFIASGIALVPLYGSSFASSTLPYEFEDESTVADNTDFVTVISDDSLSIEYSIYWDTGVYLVFSISFSDYGTTIVPTVTDAIVLPVAE
jgi:hypothetical protein